MKKWICILLCVLLVALPLAGCDSGTTTIAFLIYDARDTFISEMMSSMMDDVPDHIHVETRDAGNSQAIQNQQIIELIEDGVDLLVINAVDRLACSAIVEKCSNEGIPVIFFNREPLEDALTEEYTFYVGADADSLGIKQADMVAALFGEDFQSSPFDKNGDGVIQLIILKGEQGHQDAEKRTANCVDRIRELGYKVEILTTEVANWTRHEAYEAMPRLYAQYGDSIELIFSNNDDMALGVIDYMMEIGEFRPSSVGYNQPFVLVGVDGTTVGLQAVAEGLMYGTVRNDSTLQGNAILALADYILNDKDMASFPFEIRNGHYIYVDGAVILRENVSDFTK